MLSPYKNMGTRKTNGYKTKYPKSVGFFYKEEFSAMNFSK